MFGQCPQKNHYSCHSDLQLSTLGSPTAVQNEGVFAQLFQGSCDSPSAKEVTNTLL